MSNSKKVKKKPYYNFYKAFIITPMERSFKKNPLKAEDIKFVTLPSK